MPSLTLEQTLALETRDVSIALAAGAGCGKTFVLTERFLSHLDTKQLEGLKPADLNQLIAITFTDAAAREMRSRIREKCRQRLMSATDSEQQHWLALLRAIEAARVSTIHAFCGALLRSHAVAVGLDPAFGVLDQSDAAVLESEVIDDVLREKLAAQDDDTLELAAEFGLARVKEQITTLMSRRHDGAFDAWRGATTDQAVAAWRTCHDGDGFRIALGEIAPSAPVAEITQLLHVVAPNNDNFTRAKADLLELLPLLSQQRASASQLELIARQARLQGICKAPDWPNKQLYERYGKLCEKLRKLLKLAAPVAFNDGAAEHAARLGLLLLELTSTIVERYDRRKATLGSLDFDDLLAHAHRLLTHPDHAEVQKQVSSELRLLLVDEFQDTDQLQVELVQALCGEELLAGRLFIVGDDKQSIYRFRGAVPQVFRDLEKQVDKRGQLPLSVNFRSQPAILSFVNALFRDDFDSYRPLEPHRSQTTAEPAIEFLWAITPNKNSRAPGMKGAAKEARREEARWIARRLRGMLDSGESIVVDPKTGQPGPARLGDIAILFRALSDVQVYEQALRDYGLEYYLVGGQAYYAQQEIYDVLNLLRAVASAADEISLAGALRSPFFSLADEALFWLVESAGTLNAGLLAADLPDELSPDERAKAAGAASTIRYLREHKETLSIAELLGEALARTGYDAVLLGEFLGERKLANLHKLLEQARAADRGGTLELEGFITQLAQFVARQPKEGLAATSPEAADVIRLMTIHQSKGLEFPVVVIPDLDRSERFRSDPAALHPDLGPLVAPPDDEESAPAITGMRLYQGLERLATLEERKRLLYVAITRAADYLILSSSLESFDALKSDWMKLVAARFDLESGALRAKLPESYDAPLVRSTHDIPPTDFKPLGAARGPDLLNVLSDARGLAATSRPEMPLEVAPIAVDRAARAQFSFSLISDHLERDSELRISDFPVSDDSSLPEFHNPKSEIRIPKSTELGSLVHEVLERVDFALEKSAQTTEIRQWCELLAPEIVLQSAAEAAIEAERMVSELLASARGRELAAATNMHREVEFLLAWPPSDIVRSRTAGSVGSTERRATGSASANFSQGATGSARSVLGATGSASADLSDQMATRYLRGYIDCLYQDPSGNWHLLDYKTNDIPAAAVPHVAQQYEMQLYVYALALERSMGKSPHELALYFLRPGKEHVFTWNDRARRRAIEMATNSIEANVSLNDELVGDR